MPSLDFDATRQPTDIVAALALTRGTIYTLQNVATFATLRVREVAAMPTGGERAHRIESGGYFSMRPQGTPIWIWTDDPGGAGVIVTESA